MDIPKIDSYEFGTIVIDGQEHRKDVIILPGKVLGNWWRKEGHVLHAEDLTQVFGAAPQLLIVGLGAHGRLEIPKTTSDAIRAANIDLAALPTADAVRHYNQICHQQATAAAIHLTC